MSIQKISTEQLRRMGDREGLILQGCGGDPQEWLDGINQILTDEGILKKGTRFEEAYTFQHDGVTCLVFPFKEGMVIEMGRLAMWRLQTHPLFGGTWLSDYVPNRLGGFLQEQEQRIVKPDCPLIGGDGNIYNLLGIAGQTLREHGMEQQATEMFNRITQYQSYDSALRIIGDYVNITSVEQTENMDMENCDRIVRDGKTCKQVAPRLKKRERDAAHLVTSEYERIKDMLFHRRDRMGGNKIASAIDLTDDELVQWQETATAAQKDIWQENWQRRRH